MPLFALLASAGIASAEPSGADASEADAVLLSPCSGRPFPPGTPTRRGLNP